MPVQPMMPGMEVQQQRRGSVTDSRRGSVDSVSLANLFPGADAPLMPVPMAQPFPGPAAPLVMPQMQPGMPQVQPGMPLPQPQFMPPTPFLTQPQMQPGPPQPQMQQGSWVAPPMPYQQP